MNNLKSLVLFSAVLLLISCKKHHDDPQPAPASHLVSGKLYGKDFTYAAGMANKKVIDFQKEGFEIFLSAVKTDGCGSPEENFDVIIRTPRKTGKFTGYYAILSNPGTTDYTSYTDGNVFEITSITETTIKGNLKTSSPATNSNIEGTFEATICN